MSEMEMIMMEKRRGASDRGGGERDYIEREDRKHGGERDEMQERVEASLRTDAVRYK